MIVLDNSNYIISEIDKEAKKEAKKIQTESESEEAKLKESFEKKKKSSLEELKQEYLHKKELLFKQRISEFALKKQRMELGAQQETFTAVRKQLIEKIKGLSTTEKNNIVSGMADMLSEIATSKIKEFLIPKGTKIKQKHKAILDEFKVIGIVNEHEEYEYSLEEMINKHSNFIREIIFNEAQ